MIYADTSFLISLYLNDIHSEKASRYMKKHHDTLMMTAFQKHELHNAIRLAVFRKEIGVEARKEIFLNLTQDLEQEIFRFVSVGWGDVYRETERLSHLYTENLGNRGADILHVAIATVLGAETFLTFDKRQSQLARVAGFKLGIPMT